MNMKKIHIGLFKAGVTIGVIIVLTLSLCGCQRSMKSNYFLQSDHAKLTIEDFEGSLKLFVGGHYNEITISKNVNISQLTVEGEHNTVWISRSHHVDTEVYLSNSKVLYYD